MNFRGSPRVQQSFQQFGLSPRGEAPPADDSSKASVGSDVSAGWGVKLSGDGRNRCEALLDWLRAPAKGFGSRAVCDMQMRIDELRSLGAERIILPEVPIERMRQDAVRIAWSKAATLPPPRRTAAHGRDRLLRLQLL